MSLPEPLVFQKSKAGRPAGFVAYLLLSAALATIPAAIVAIVVASASGSQNILVIFPGVLAVLTLPIAAVFWFRLKRRYLGTLRVWPDRIEISEGRRTREMPISGLEILQCDPGPDNAILDLKDAEGRRYRSVLWPSAAADAIREVAIPRITRELGARIARGEEVVFREYRMRYAGRVALLFLVFAWGTMGALAVLRKDPEHSGAGQLVLKLAAFSGIPALFLTLRRIRSSGATLSREGIRVRNAWIAWEDAEEAVTDAHGLAIRHASGLTRVASPGCANYRSLVNLVGERIGSRSRAPRWRGATSP